MGKIDRKWTKYKVIGNKAHDINICANQLHHLLAIQAKMVVTWRSLIKKFLNHILSNTRTHADYDDINSFAQKCPKKLVGPCSKIRVDLKMVNR